MISRTTRTYIIGQIGRCIGGSFNIHIWAWSASPSVQVGRLQKTRRQSAGSDVTYLASVKSQKYLPQKSLDNCVTAFSA